MLAMSMVNGSRGAVMRACKAILGGDYSLAREELDGIASLRVCEARALNGCLREAICKYNAPATNAFEMLSFEFCARCP